MRNEYISPVPHDLGIQDLSELQQLEKNAIAGRQALFDALAHSSIAKDIDFTSGQNLARLRYFEAGIKNVHDNYLSTIPVICIFDDPEMRDNFDRLEFRQGTKDIDSENYIETLEGTISNGKDEARQSLNIFSREILNDGKDFLLLSDSNKKNLYIHKVVTKRPSDERISVLTVRIPVIPLESDIVSETDYFYPAFNQAFDDQGIPVDPDIIEIFIQEKNKDNNGGLYLDLNAQADDEEKRIWNLLFFRKHQEFFTELARKILTFPQASLTSPRIGNLGIEGIEVNILVQNFDHLEYHNLKRYKSGKIRIIVEPVSLFFPDDNPSITNVLNPQNSDIPIGRLIYDFELTAQKLTINVGAERKIGNEFEPKTFIGLEQFRKDKAIAIFVARLNAQAINPFQTYIYIKQFFDKIRKMLKMSVPVKIKNKIE